jgi:hypothetical protein
MRTHGYGAGGKSTVFIQSSNVIWGYFIKILPSSVLGVPGYSLATFLILFFFLMSICLFGIINKINKENLIIIILTIILILFDPIISPQFTINAGLITIAGLLFLRIYFQFNQIKYLLFSFICFFLGFIIREKMFYATIFVGFFFIVNKKFFNRKFFFLSFLFIAILASAKHYNNQMYNQEELKKYLEFQKARVFWIDYKGFSFLNKEIRNKHKFTENDIFLLNNWFFIDSYLADPERLNRMRADMPAIINEKKGNIKVGIEFLWNQRILPLSLCAFLILLLFPSFRLGLSWLMLFIIIIYIAHEGRPAIYRVYVPLLTVLIIIPVLELIIKDAIRNKVYIIISVIFICNNINLYNSIFNHTQISKQSKEFHQEDFKFLNQVDYVVTWGSVFPHTIAYPVFPKKIFDFRQYGLGTGTLNPYSVSQIEENNNNGFIKNLKSDKGLFIWANDTLMSSLQIYCSEHHNKNLTMIKIKKQYLYHAHCK